MSKKFKLVGFFVVVAISYYIYNQSFSTVHQRENNINLSLDHPPQKDNAKVDLNSSVSLKKISNDIALNEVSADSVGMDELINIIKRDDDSSTQLALNIVFKKKIPNSKLYEIADILATDKLRKFLISIQTTQDYYNKDYIRFLSEKIQGEADYRYTILKHLNHSDIANEDIHELYSLYCNRIKSEKAKISPIEKNTAKVLFRKYQLPNC